MYRGVWWCRGCSELQGLRGLDAGAKPRRHALGDSIFYHHAGQTVVQPRGPAVQDKAIRGQRVQRRAHKHCTTRRALDFADAPARAAQCHSHVVEVH